MHTNCNSNFKNISWKLMRRQWARISTLVKVIMVFAYFFTLRALTKFFSQYPPSTFSIMKEASPSLWPKGDRLTGSIITLLVQLLVTLALSTCWGSRSPPITALERCPCWLHRADQAYGWFIWSPRCSPTRPGFILTHHGATRLHFIFSLSIYICVCVCVCVFQGKVNS